MGTYIGVAVALGATAAASQLFCVSGKSMSPTINKTCHHSILILDKLSCKMGLYTPRVNDIVAYCKPGDSSKAVVKRVVAVAGEVVESRKLGTVIVEPGCFWAIGDNLYNSVDSNDYGQIQTSSIIGKCLCIVPLQFNVGFKGWKKFGFTK